MTPPRVRLVLDSLVAAFVLAVGFLIAWSFSHPIIEQLRFLRDLPRATLDAPKSGPAIYSGRLYGPTGRVTPLGEKAAITWWWVTAGTSKSRKTTCFERQLDKLELDDGKRTLPYVALSSAASLSLLSDERGYDWTDPLVVDLGSQSAHSPKALAAAAQKCNSGTNPAYVERWVTQGAQVEVVACYRDGALRECNAPIRSLLGVGTIGPHRVRRAENAYVPMLVFGGVSTVLLLAFVSFAIFERARALAPLRPNKGPAST